MHRHDGSQPSIPGATSPGIRTRTPPPGRPADVAGRPSSNRKTATLTPPGTARFPTADTRTTRGMNANRSPAPPAGRRGKDNPRHPILTADPCAPTAPAQPHDAPSAPPRHPHGSTPSGPAAPVHHPRDRHPCGHRNTPPAESRLRRASPARSSLPPDFLRFSNPTSLVSGFYAYFIHLPTR